MTGLAFCGAARRQVARDQDGRHKPRGDRSAAGGCMTWPMVQSATSRRARGEPRSPRSWDQLSSDQERAGSSALLSQTYR
jgi:hypothetical protein